MKTPEQYVKQISDMQVDNSKEKSEFKEGWWAACSHFYDVIEQVIADAQADVKERLEAVERRSKEVDVMLDSLLKKLNRV